LSIRQSCPVYHRDDVVDSVCGELRTRDNESTTVSLFFVTNHFFDLSVMSGRNGVSTVFGEPNLIGGRIPTSVCLGQYVQQSVVVPSNWKRIEPREQDFGANQRLISYFS
jgi:hypothetical protein